MQVIRERTVALVEADDNEPLGEYEVRGRTLATLVSPGTEIASAFAPADPSTVEYPKPIGYSSVFEVEEIGSKVSASHIGARVFSTGPHQSQQRAHEDKVFELPPGLAPEIAVFARIIAVPLAAVITTAARPGDRVGIVGLGLVGHLGAKAFHASGYRVTAWDPLPERRKGLGTGIRVLAAPVLDDPGDVFEVVVDASGHDGATVQAASVVAKNGELVLTGTPWAQRTETSAHELLTLIFHRYLHVRSGWEWQLPLTATDFRRGSVASNFRLAIDWLANGTVAVDGLSETISPEFAQRAFDSLADRAPGPLTYVFDWSRLR
ncbi:zinc-dependent alcohol dehydrogenase [Mycetocola zhujimingii]|uniref:zinc-dependent alcohol dehydrogenase n=1 Tax=Mycetocola zhujimingii TaxID=2079792 RepID=UPI000D3874C5|nr:zinc-binding alcohol dehydrogenase [Mycetocola zhujimingii]AWB85443.1 dehydrogenase [Mycetocola zhujimingii]